MQVCYAVLHVEANGTGVEVGDGDGTASGAGRRRHDKTGEEGGGRGKLCGV